jgi:hypothetical protein
MSIPQQLWALLSLHHLGHFGALWHATQLLLCAGWLWCALSVSGRTRLDTRLDSKRDTTPPSP